MVIVSDFCTGYNNDLLTLTLTVTCWAERSVLGAVCLELPSVVKSAVAFLI